MKSIFAVALICACFANTLAAVSWNSLLGDKIFPENLDSSRSRSGHIAVLVQEINGLLDDPDTLTLVYNNYAKLYNKEKSVEGKSNVRESTFKDNLLKITKHNLEAEAGIHTWIEGTNQFTDLTDQEFQQMYLGYSVNLTAALESAGIPSVELNLDLENFDLTQSSTKDWTKEGLVTKPKNQGRCGSCYAFACAGALESSVGIKKRSARQMVGDDENNDELLDLSEQQVVDCSDNGGCQGGYWDATYEYMKAGLVSEESYPYTASKGDCQDSDGERVASVGNWGKVAKNERAVLAAVAQYGPLATAVDANNWNRYRGGVYNGPCSTRLNHAVLTTGYDTKTISIKNSWGESWGESGYIRLARGKNQCGVNNDVVWMEAA